MKNLFKSFVVGALLLGSVGCSDMFKEDLYEINNEIDKINQRIDSLCNAVNTNIASLQTIIDVMQDNDYVDSITPIVENGVTIGYEIVFTQSGSVKIYHGEKGETGATGHSPVVGVKQAEDGRWYWTIDGEWMVNAEGKKILAEAIDGEDGAPGADGIPGVDGITPKLKVQDNYWYISYDNGTTWERLGKATGEAGTDGDSMFQSVNYNEDYVELVLVDGTVLTIPTWASHMLLVDEIAKINNNISAIQAAVKALESNDYVQKVTPVEDKEGNVIGYTLQFAFTGDVTIYHGEDGEKGEDGHTPVIGVKQFNGEWYWTIDGEWLVDGNGEMVPTSGEDGAEGAEGQAGITPELKIEDDYWYVSYDKGQTWTKLGKAKGEDGAAGGDGAAGDAFFEDVDTSDEYYIILTLADGTEIKIPTWKAHQALADAVAQLNTNFESLQVIITGLQNNDYITGYTPIIDPQTNEEIGYTLHFFKGADIEIYHGTSPAAPQIGIKKHPQYGLCWTYNGQYIYDEAGKPVALPQDGADAVAPKFKIEDGRWWMSTDGGRSWEDIGQATGDQGQQGETGATGGSGDSFFKSIEPEFATDANGNVLKDAYGKPIVAYIVMTLAGDNDGEDVVYKVPTEYITSDINKRLAAIEAQFSTISTIVNALQNAEYIKEVVELYEGPALVGYEITFVKYAIGADGKLTETTRKSTIRNGGAGAAGTVVAAEYDEATDTWYWTLDGEPLKDADGNYVAINGKNGQAGITPLMRINTDTNEWEVSYDNGKTYTTTGVKATGPQGPQGNPGQGGAAGDSFFADVYKDGDYWVFERVDGNKIMVPTAEAFASLAEKVAALDESSKAFASLINGKKFIESCEPFTNDSGSGYKLVLVSLNAETGETVKEDYFIFNGEDAETPVVGLRQDETTGDWYWTVDGEDILVDGKPVKANGPQGIDGPVPSFRIDPTNGHLYVTVNGTESDLGRVVGTNGSAGEAGSSSSIVVTPGEDGQLTIDFIGGDGLTSTIVVPSWEAFVALQDAVSALNTNVETISALVYGHKYVESFKELENGGYEFVVRYYDENAKEWKTEVHAIDITTADEIGVKMDPEDENYYWTKGGEWLLDAAGNRVMVDGSAERTLEFKSENDGKLYYKYSDETEWTVLDIAVSESVVESNVVVKEENGKVTVTVLDDAGMILYSFSAPSWEAFEALQGRVIALEEQVTDIYDLIYQLTTNYQALSGDVNNMAAKLSKCKFIGEYEYDEERKGHVIYFVDIDGNKLQDAAGDFETIFIADGEDGEDFDASMLSFTEVDGEYFWTYNGEMLVDAAGKPVKAHGADGRTPEFDLIDDELVYRYEGDEEWISLGNVKGSAAAANITVDPSDVPMWIEIEYSYVDEDGKESVSKIKVPTYHAYEMAVQEIAAIQSNIDLVEEFLNKGKFVADYELEYDENGMIIGCTMTTVEYKLQEDGSYRVFTSPAEFKPSQTMHLEVDENEGVWYLVGYKKGEDGKIEEVRRPLSQSAFTFVPKIAVDKGYIYLAKVSVPGTDYTDTQKWECLGAVVELLGGETGSAQGALKSVEEIDGYICFTFSNGDVLKVPSDAKFQEVLERLDEVEGAVETIQNDIVDLTTSLTALETELAQVKENQAKYLTSAEFEEWKSETQFVKSVVKDGEKLTFEVVNGNGEIVKTVEYTVNHPISVTTKENGDLYWVINGKEYPVESKPKFQVDQLSGNLQFSIDGSDWTTLESASNNVVDVVFTNDPAVGPDENLNPADANWVGIYYSEKNIIWMPTYKNFNELVATVTRISEKVAALDRFVTGRGFVKDFKEVKDDKGNVVGFTATFVDYKYDETSKEYVLNADTEELTFTYENPVSVIEKDGKYYWHIKTADDYVDILADGSSYPKVELYNGKIYVSVDSRSTTPQADIEGGNEAYWKVMDITQTVDTDTHATCTEETIDGYLYYVIKMWKEDGTTTEIKVPSAAAFSALVEKVTTLENTVAGLQTLLSALDFTFVTGITEKKDASGNVIGIDFTTKTVTDGAVADGQSGSVSLTGLVIPDGTKGFKVVTGYDKDGKPVYTEMSWDHTPVFATHGGKVYMSIDPTANVGEIASQLKESKGGWIEVYSIPEDVNTNYYGKSEPIKETIDGVEVIVGYNIIFPDGNGEYLEAIKVVSMAGYKLLVERVTALEKNIKTIDNVLSGMSFVKSIEPVYDNATNKNIIGFKGEIVTVTGSVAGNTASLGTPAPFTYTSTNYVVPVKVDDVWYWSAHGTILCAIDGTFVPEIVLDGGYIYVSKPGAGDFATDKKAADFADKWYKLDDDLTDDNGTFGSYVDKGTYYEITFPGSQKPIEVPKYYQTPVITFSTDGTTFEEGTLKLGTASSGTVTCIITGSFPEGYKPQIYTTCEGHFTSSMGKVTEVSKPQYTVDIEVNATTAYVGDEMSGKLTVYCPYYGTTGIGQINLTAEGANNLVVTNVEPTVKEGNDTEVRISIGGVNETVNTNAPLRVEAVNDDGTKATWLERGSVTKDEKGNIIQKLEMKPYVVDVTTSLQQRPSRQCTLTVYTPAGRMVGRHILEQRAIVDLSQISDTELESANCYVISGPGRYMLPAQKGNSTDKILPTKGTIEPSFEKVASDVDVTIVDKGMIKVDETDYVVFDVNYDEVNKSTQDIKDGNIVMALKNGNTTLWSWHLWLCKGKILNIGDLDDQEYSITGANMLNRNLGASSSTGSGTYYKWGCKEPFIDGDYQGEGSISYEKTWTPTSSSTKQVADPCPPGYKVPTNDVWLGKDVWYTTNAANPELQVSNFIYDVLSPNVMYPYSEYLLADGNLNKDNVSMVKYDKPGFYYEAPGVNTDEYIDVTIEYTIPIVNKKGSTTVSFPQMAQDKFYDLDMDIAVSSQEGRVWSIDGYLGYEYRSLNVSSLTEEAFRNAININSYKHKRRKLKSYKITDVSFSIRNGLSYKSEPEWGEYEEVTPNMSDADKAILLVKLYQEKDVINSIDYQISQSIDNSLGYQVRCVKEVKQE